MDLDRFFPEDDPSWDRLWDHRPFGPEFTLNPFSRDWPYAVVWHGFGIGALAAWTRVTGRGVSLSMALGELVWGPPTVQAYANHVYQRGAAPSFWGGLLQRTPMILRGAARLGGPLGLAITAMEVGRMVTPASDRHSSSRVLRARLMSSGGYHDTSWMVAYGHFQDKPYIDAPDTDEGRIWYSFNP